MKTLCFLSDLARSTNIHRQNLNYKLNYCSVRCFNELVKTEHRKTYAVLTKTGSEAVVNNLSNWFVNKFRILFPSIINMELSPPECVRGMKELDREQFKRKIYLPTLKVPNSKLPDISKHFKRALCKIIGVKQIINLAENDPDKDTHKLILMDPHQFKTKNDIKDNTKDFLDGLTVSLDSFNLHEIELNYNNWGHADILKAILPVESDGVAGFSSIGHIVHLNLRDEIADYKHVVGAVLLDKVSTAKTVVNKVNTIDNTYRNFQMEVIAGEENFRVLTKESGNSFEFDFSKVYWNPRLGTEHKRIIDLLQAGDVVYDVFAGVGPFAVPAGKKRSIVFANDLNPDSYNWLKHNFNLNKIRSGFHTYNLDGREFIRTVIKEDLMKRWQEASESSFAIHIVMNLPALAIEFIDAFPGLLSESALQQNQCKPLPRVHCYCFSKSEDPEQDTRDRAKANLGHDLENCTVRSVRNVAPNKEMMCVSFDLTWDILVAPPNTQGDAVEPPEKKTKSE